VFHCTQEENKTPVTLGKVLICPYKNKFDFTRNPKTCSLQWL